MTDRTLGWWLLVALAIGGLAVAAPAVSAHGDEPTQENETAVEMPVDGNATDWATWMNGHMTDQMGPATVKEMEAHMGVTVDEMAQNVADDNHAPAGMNGRGYGC